MEFAFTEEQLLVQKTVRQFAKDKLLPNYSRWDRGEKIGRAEIREVAELGIFGLRVPEQFGGQHADFVTCGIMSEELSRGDFNYTLFLQLGMMIAELLAAYARPAVQAEWLPRMATGDAIMAIALTEPGGRLGRRQHYDPRRQIRRRVCAETERRPVSPLPAMRTPGWSWPGRPRVEREGISAFLVPFDAPGVSRQVYASAGARLHQRGSLFFDNVRIPAAYLVGDENGGFYQAMMAFDFNRALVALAALGAGPQQSIDETIEYTKGRRVFGKPLATFEGVGVSGRRISDAARSGSPGCL